MSSREPTNPYDPDFEAEEHDRFERYHRGKGGWMERFSLMRWDGNFWQPTWRVHVAALIPAVIAVLLFALSE